MKCIVVAIAVAAAGWAQPALAPPQIGFVQDGFSSLRPVLGVAGNFILGNAVFTGVSNAAYSGSFGLLKTDTSLIATDSHGQVLNAAYAPQGPASFAFFRDGSPAFAYLPGSNLLFAWYGTGFQMISFDCQPFPATAVLGISAPDAAHVVFLVQAGDGLQEISFLIETGEVESQTALPGVAAPALRLASGLLVYADANGIVIRAADSSEVHVDAQLPDKFSLSPMGAGWLQLSDLSSASRFAIRVTPGREAFYSLPETGQAPEVSQ